MYTDVTTSMRPLSMCVRTVSLNVIVQVLRALSIILCVRTVNIYTVCPCTVSLVLCVSSALASLNVYCQYKYCEPCQYV